MHRPFITLAAYDAATGGKFISAGAGDVVPQFPDPVCRSAMAIEAFHKASLVHDDIEDDDAFRYHEVLRQQRTSELPPTLHQHALDLLLAKRRECSGKRLRFAHVHAVWIASSSDTATKPSAPRTLAMRITSDAARATAIRAPPTPSSRINGWN